MTNNKTDKPLYKLLNEQRTQGIVEVNGNKLIFKKVSGFNSLCTIHIQKAWDERSNPIDDKEAKANAQYTAIAVNNLASLAEALERAMRIIERLSDEYREAVNKHSSYTNGEFKILSEALNRIK